MGSQSSDSTLSYYATHADEFCAGSQHVDMSAQRAWFLERLPKKATILDAGCGSGRDAHAFIGLGHDVVAFDASPAMVERASAFIGQPVQSRTFDDVIEEATYDGIWACASLLHVPARELPQTLGRLWRALKPGGSLYVSFKLGDGERVVEGRHFTDATQGRLVDWIGTLTAHGPIEMWETVDVRPGRNDRWLNALVTRQPRVVTGGANPFLPQLEHAIRHADQIDFAVAFIKTTGMRLLLPELEEAMAEVRTGLRPAVRIRVITSDYLDITDPEALRMLRLLQQQGADVRVFETRGKSFHMKAYVFAALVPPSTTRIRGTAFIGSSNISRQALTDGLEWNYRVEYPGDDGYLEARDRFEELFANPNAIELTDDWIDAYQRRRRVPMQSIEPGSTEVEPPPVPTAVQFEALAALRHTREVGFKRGLVVLATGLGKTWLSAFDARSVGAERVLFVAHREEILQQAAKTLLRVFPEKRVGLYDGQARETECAIICASVQTLGKSQHLERFPADHFDYIVVDEFHHAAAKTYRNILQHFKPKFLLGLTATPDRTDQSDIISLCDDNVVFECPLFRGVNDGLLAPFHYYGIADETVDYEAIPWRNGKFDLDTLTTKLATSNRAEHALRVWRKRGLQRTLVFCASIRHADFMATEFAKAGIRAAAVHGESQLRRGDAIAQLSSGELQVVFSVDLFSEGVDVPLIDTVMMLRPTESKVLFLQQLGRGLRKAPGKEKLVVLDFIGNHRSFLLKPQALFGLGATHQELAKLAAELAAGTRELPEGCFVNYDLALIDMMRNLEDSSLAKAYEDLKLVLGRRPTLTEYFRSGASISTLRRQFGSWFAFVASQGDLVGDELAAAEACRPALAEIETTRLTKSFKLVLLSAFVDLNGWAPPPTLAALAAASHALLARRPELMSEVPEALRGDGTSTAWQKYWRENPVSAWIGEDRPDGAQRYFEIDAERFRFTMPVEDAWLQSLSGLVQELVDHRFATYERRGASSPNPSPSPATHGAARTIELPSYADYGAACAASPSAETRRVRVMTPVDSTRAFIVQAADGSMAGGSTPIPIRANLVMERLSAPAPDGEIVLLERQHDGLREQVVRQASGAGEARRYQATGAGGTGFGWDSTVREIATVRAILDPLVTRVGEAIMREDIPPLFGEVFSTGNWQSGHVSLPRSHAIALLVTLSKQGKTEAHRYVDRWDEDGVTFHWQSQNSTSPTNKRGLDIINHERDGTAIHLFVREHKVVKGKGAPFVYCGRVRYDSHQGSLPMSVQLRLIEA